MEVKIIGREEYINLRDFLKEYDCYSPSYRDVGKKAFCRGYEEGLKKALEVYRNGDSFKDGYEQGIKDHQIIKGIKASLQTHIDLKNKEIELLYREKSIRKHELVGAVSMAHQTLLEIGRLEI